VTEIIYNYVSIESIVLFIAILSLYSLFIKYAFNSDNNDQFDEVKSRIEDLVDQLEQQANSIDLLVGKLNDIEDIVTSDRVKVARMVERGVPEDVASEFVVCGEVGGEKGVE
jgi:hypothetical protein